MNINFTYGASVDIIFDETFKVKYKGSLDDIADMMVYWCEKHHFQTAVALDDETGEILIKMEEEE